MKLQHNQARRFERIFDALLSFTATKRGVLAALRSNNRLTSGQTSLDLIAYIWDSPEGLETIDQFIKLNPLRFNRTDLREVESWKLGVHDHFVVIDDGLHSILIGHDCAFDVRGINVEIADIFSGNLPAFIDAVVLPFDHTITIGGAILPTPMGAAAALRMHFLTEVKRFSSERRIARNARDFVRIASIALENKAKERKESLDEKQDDHFVYDFTQATDLADTNEAIVSSETAEPAADSEVEVAPEAEAPIEAAVEAEAPAEAPAIEAPEPEAEAPVVEAPELEPEAQETAEEAPEPEAEAIVDEAPVDRAAIIEDIQTQVRKGRPTQGLKGYTSAFKKNELLEIARTIGDVEVSNSLKKGDLVNIVIENADITTDNVLDAAREAGGDALSDLKRVVEAQGRLKIAFDEVEDSSSVPAPLFPITQLYQVDDTFVVVMPNEIRDALADLNWDEVLAWTRT